MQIDTYNLRITEQVFKTWQHTVSLMAEIMNVPAGLIMRVHKETIEVFVKSQNQGNVYEKGASEELNSGLYCESVIESREELLIPNALKDPLWDHNPDIKLGMISYLGLPLEWPNGEAFGTICVLDQEENQYSESYRLLLSEFRTIVELGLQSVYEHELLEMNERALREKIQENQQYIDVIDRNVLVVNATDDGVILDISKAFIELSEYPKEELLGKNYKEFLVNENPYLVEAITEDLESKDQWKGEMQFARSDGTIFFIEANVDPLIDHQGKQIGYTATCKNITDRKKWQDLSITDELTGLFNRRYFNTVFDKELNRTRRDCKIFGLFIMDIDNFKLYNDTYGHDQGDIVLSKVGEILDACLLRASDYAFRIGGEEFAGIVELEKIHDIESIVERIRDRVENASIVHEKSNVCPVVTVSIGIKCVDFKYDSDITMAEMYREADEALYKAKNSGKNKYLFATS